MVKMTVNPAMKARIPRSSRPRSRAELGRVGIPLSPRISAPSVAHCRAGRGGGGGCRPPPCHRHAAGAGPVGASRGGRSARRPRAPRPSTGRPAPAAARTARGTTACRRRTPPAVRAGRRGWRPGRAWPARPAGSSPAPGRPRPSSAPATGSRPRGASPRVVSALDGSPTSRSTSAGRRKRSSMNTCCSQSRSTAANASSTSSLTEWVSPVATT